MARDAVGLRIRHLSNPSNIKAWGGRRVAMARLAATGLAAFTSLIGWVALAIEFGRSVSHSLRQGHSLAEALFLYFRYFTIVTNIGIAVLMSMTAVRLAANRRLPPPIVFNAALIYILVTFATYEVMLRHQWRPEGLQFATDAVIHDAVPMLMLAFWLGFRPQGVVGWRDPLWMLLYPAAYLALTLLAGPLGEGYPYSFLDVEKLGYTRVFVTSAVFLTIFYGLGLVTTGVSMARSSSKDDRSPAA